MSDTPPADSDRPFFTVVIPTYRRDVLLLEALASVRDQMWTDFEVRVVDDDSDDSPTADVVASLGDSRFHYLQNDRGRGGAGTRNAGIDRSLGRWIAFLDDDDTWLPTLLSRFRAAIEAGGPELGMVYAGRVKVDPERGLEFEQRRPTARGWMRDILLRSNVIGGFSCVAIRADLLRAVGGLDERFPSLQDIDLYVRIADRAPIEVIADPLVRVRRGSESRISGDAEKKLAGSELFDQKHWDFIARDPVLRHRSAAHRFAYALAAGRCRTAARSFLWTINGVFVDRSNVVRVVVDSLRGMRACALRPFSTKKT